MTTPDLAKIMSADKGARGAPVAHQTASDNLRNNCPEGANAGLPALLIAKPDVQSLRICDHSPFYLLLKLDLDFSR